MLCPLRHSEAPVDAPLPPLQGAVRLVGEPCCEQEETPAPREQTISHGDGQEGGGGVGNELKVEHVVLLAKERLKAAPHEAEAPYGE